LTVESSLQAAIFSIGGGQAGLQFNDLTPENVHLLVLEIQLPDVNVRAWLHLRGGGRDRHWRDERNEWLRRGNGRFFFRRFWRRRTNFHRKRIKIIRSPSHELDIVVRNVTTNSSTESKKDVGALMAQNQITKKRQRLTDDITIVNFDNNISGLFIMRQPNQ
jgi:hypothetical protein